MVDDLTRLPLGGGTEQILAGALDAACQLAEAPAVGAIAIA